MTTPAKKAAEEIAREWVERSGIHPTVIEAIISRHYQPVVERVSELEDALREVTFYECYCPADGKICTPHFAKRVLERVRAFLGREKE